MSLLKHKFSLVTALSGDICELSKLMVLFLFSYSGFKKHYLHDRAGSALTDCSKKKHVKASSVFKVFPALFFFFFFLFFFFFFNRITLSELLSQIKDFLKENMISVTCSQSICTTQHNVCSNNSPLINMHWY